MHTDETKKLIAFLEKSPDCFSAAANIAKTLDELKKRGLWVYGADMDGENYCETNLKGSVALVIGSEGFGMSRLVKEACDYVVSIPMNGKINSLNASVAAGIMIYELIRKR